MDNQSALEKDLRQKEQLIAARLPSATDDAAAARVPKGMPSDLVHRLLDEFESEKRRLQQQLKKERVEVQRHKKRAEALALQNSILQKQMAHHTPLPSDDTAHVLVGRINPLALEEDVFVI